MQKDALAEVKRLMQSSDLLLHFDGSKPLVLARDASPYMQWVLFWLTGWRIGLRCQSPFASRTLAPAEKKHSQLDKEPSLSSTE